MRAQAQGVQRERPCCQAPAILLESGSAGTRERCGSFTTANARPPKTGSRAADDARPRPGGVSRKPASRLGESG
jgi:hypothetical protein